MSKKEKKEANNKQNEDLYLILEAKKTFTQDEIKKNYKKLAAVSNF